MRGVITKRSDGADELEPGESPPANVMKYLPSTVLGALLVCTPFPTSGQQSCDRHGSEPGRVTDVTVSKAVAERGLHGEIVAVEGVLWGRFSRRLCSGREPEAEPCLRLAFQQLAHPDLETVLNQWNGARVRLAGRLENLRNGTATGAEDPRFLLHVKHIRILDLPASPAYCLGYEGPLEAAPAEDYYDSSWKGYRILPTQFRDGSRVLLHAYKARAGYYPPGWRTGLPAEVVAFPIPSPYSGRDITSFAALGKEAFVFKLRDGNLYAWTPHGLTLVERSSGSTHIALWALLIDGNVYYSVDSEDPLTRTQLTTVKRLSPELTAATAWESSTYIIETVEYSDAIEDGVADLGIRKPGETALKTVRIPGVRQAPE